MIFCISNTDFLKNTKLLIWLYCLSTVFMIFFSISAIKNWPNHWAQISIVVACMFPGLMILASSDACRNNDNSSRYDVMLILILFFLGGVNILLSEARWESLKGMGLFLMSGVWIYSVTRILFRKRFACKVFCWLCAFCFLVLIIWGGIEFYQGGGGLCQRVQLFSENPIPAGSLLILLSVGPVLLLPHVEKCWRLPLTLLLVLGGVVILLIGQRGAILALLCMLVLGGLAKFKRFWIYPVFMVLLLGLGFSYKDKLPNLYYNKLVNWESVFIRLEYYRIAYQVVKEKPVFGIGFNAPIVRFIPPDYEAKYFRSDRGFSFNSVVAGVQTFDNMILCFFAEAGSLFALTYIFLFGCLFKRSFRLVGIGFGARFYIFGIGAIVIGFAVQSLTFDSLRYPHLNWVFHSILGVLANLDVLCDKDPLRQASSPRTGSDILLGASLNN